jgi:outer membrane protein OmpA-like peptidoglycan-associated protein
MRTIKIIIISLIFCSCSVKRFSLSDTKLKAGQVFTTYGILYSLGQDSILVDKCKLTLDSIFNFLRYHPDIKVELGAHTDIRGDDEKNLALSQYRANRLKEYFIKQTINSDRLVAKGFGETKSIRSKKEQEKLGDHARNVNRRTTIKIIK